MRSIGLVALGLVFLVAGCDTARDDSITPVRLVEPLSDVKFAFQATLDTSAVEVTDLSEHFAVASPSTPSDALTYEVAAEGVAAVELDGPLLHVRPLDVGVGAVVVRARVGSSAATADTFAVEVTTECPPGPRAGEVDFLPLVEGDTWQFRFNTSGYGGSTSYRGSGTLTLSLISVTCAGGTSRTVEAEEHREGQLIRYVPSVPGTADTTAINGNRMVQFVETAEGVQLPWPSLTVPRYYPASLDTARTESGYVEATLVPGGLVSFANQGIPHTSYRSSFSVHRLPPSP